jgi:hypothetical protein
MGHKINYTLISMFTLTRKDTTSSSDSQHLVLRSNSIRNKEKVIYTSQKYSTGRLSQIIVAYQSVDIESLLVLIETFYVTVQAVMVVTCLFDWMALLVSRLLTEHRKYRQVCMFWRSSTERYKLFIPTAVPLDQRGNHPGGPSSVPVPTWDAIVLAHQWPSFLPYSWVWKGRLGPAEVISLIHISNAYHLRSWA